jgi:hypothetical protein
MVNDLLHEDSTRSSMICCCQGGCIAPFTKIADNRRWTVKQRMKTHFLWKQEVLFQHRDDFMLISGYSRLFSKKLYTGM